MIQTITLLGSSRRILLVQVEIIQYSNPENLIGLILAVVDCGVPAAGLLPRRNDVYFTVTEDASGAIDDVGNVEELDVPSGDDIRIIAGPIAKEPTE